jgi:hypothetical protein
MGNSNESTGRRAFWLGPEALCRCGDDEEAVRPQRVFDEHGDVLDHRAEI